MINYHHPDFFCKFEYEFSLNETLLFAVTGEMKKSRGQVSAFVGMAYQKVARKGRKNGLSWSE